MKKSKLFHNAPSRRAVRQVDNDSRLKTISTFGAGLLFATSALVPLLSHCKSPERSSEIAQQATSTSTKVSETLNASEIFDKPLTPFAELLEQSHRVTDPATGSTGDNILLPEMVNKMLLAEKFHYTGREIGSFNGSLQRIYSFAIIGQKSGQHSSQEKSINQWRTTTLADAINLLLEREGLKEEKIKEWIVWLYKTSFNISIELERITIAYSPEGKVERVIYNPQEKFPEFIEIEVFDNLDTDRIIESGRAFGKTSDPQKMLDGNNTLHLPTGISPQYDIKVPESLIPQNPLLKLKIKNADYVLEIPVEAIVKKAKAHLQKLINKKGERTKQAKVYGQKYFFSSHTPVFEKNDPYIRTLAKSILEDIPKENDQKRILTLVRFVQSLGYKDEYDAEMDRPGLLVLFNGGGDCNDLANLLLELLLASGYDGSLFLEARKDSGSAFHAFIGLPAKYFPNSPALPSSADKQWIRIELGGGVDYYPPGNPIYDPSIEQIVNSERFFAIQDK